MEVGTWTDCLYLKRSPFIKTIASYLMDRRLQPIFRNSFGIWVKINWPMSNRHLQERKWLSTLGSRFLYQSTTCAKSLCWYYRSTGYLNSIGDRSLF